MTVSLGTGGVVSVTPPRPQPAQIVPVPGVPGPEGPQGPEGERGFDGTFGGTAWWADNGPPTTVIGSKPGDKYLDVDTGDVYTLGE